MKSLIGLKVSPWGPSTSNIWTLQASQCCFWPPRGGGGFGSIDPNYSATEGVLRALRGISGLGEIGVPNLNMMGHPIGEKGGGVGNILGI